MLSETFYLPHLGKYSINNIAYNVAFISIAISIVLLKLNDFLTQGHLVTLAIKYTVNVVVSQNSCKIEMLLLQNTNSKSCVAYQISEIWMALSDLQGHSPTASVYKWIFHRVVQQQT